MGAAIIAFGPVLPEIVWKPRFTNRKNTLKMWIQGTRKKRRGGVRRCHYWRSKGFEEKYLRNFLRYNNYAVYPQQQKGGLTPSVH